MNLPATLDEQVKSYRRAAKSTNTLRAYRADVNVYVEWCKTRSLEPFPAVSSHLCAFLVSQAESAVKAATIARRVAALTHFHRAAHLPSPIDDSVREVMAGIRRRLGTAPIPKEPLLADHVRRMVAAIDIRAALEPRLLLLRDRALILVGFAGALRRSELAALTVRDVRRLKDGLLLTLRQSKTDQEGHGQEVAIVRGRGQFCPVTALQDWIWAGALTEGWLFRGLRHGEIEESPLSGKAIAQIVKQRAAQAGIDPHTVSAHSLRSGFVTSAALKGASLLKIAEVTRHKNLENVRRYFNSELWQNHAATGLLD